MTTDKKVIEYTVGFGLANILAFVIAIPILIVLLLPFIIVWNYQTFLNGKDSFMDYFLLILIGGTVVHELLHGITWAYFATKGIKSIKFGVKWKYLTPYCHCKEPLKVKHYMLGGAMPLVVMGIIPAIVC